MKGFEDIPLFKSDYLILTKIKEEENKNLIWKVNFELLNSL